MSNQAKAPFFDVPKSRIATSQGDVELPISYFDASNYMALFLVPESKVQAKLVDTPLEAARVGGRGVVSLIFFKYRDTSIGPYHEVGLAILAAPKGEPREMPSLSGLLQDSVGGGLGFYVLDLPVSSPLANAAGREIWGYPKFVAELPIELNNDRFEGRVCDPEGKLIMELVGERGQMLPEETPGKDLITYSILNGQLLRTRIQTCCHQKTSGGGSLQVVLGDSQHRMVKNLLDLGLANKTPKLLQVSEDFQSLLFAGEPVPKRSTT